MLSATTVKVFLAVNTFFTFVAIVLSIVLQQMTPFMIRAANFARFCDGVSDADRDAILRSAADAAWIGILPLVITNMAWIAIWCIPIAPKTPATPPQSTECDGIRTSPF